ncbi:MAG: putative N-acetylmannosamine-6-phosphate 2-epimerase [Candidatus Eremiobacteraeota bacterium]|nr:putative N-acetylmannosamine-6-phosphate 2-epimerase [Candidatus Eremiobacteraeota bacterium]
MQAWPGSALDVPSVIAALARCAQDNGACALRIQGEANITAVVDRVDVPVIGLIKRSYDGFEPYITPTTQEVSRVVNAGASIVAFDATSRVRPRHERVSDIVAAIHNAGAVSMGDCAEFSDGVAACALGVHIIATTLASYTKTTAGLPLPALDLVEQFKTLECFVVCEGGVKTPLQVREAFRAGADSVVVGTAITNIDWLVQQFTAAVQE